MSTMLALAAITGALKSVLTDDFIGSQAQEFLGELEVSALPPDLISAGDITKPRLNLFLYQVTPNVAWRNMPPVTDAAGRHTGNMPLALDAHYLVTAYGVGATDFEMEMLLGYAVDRLHHTSLLSRELIQHKLKAEMPPIKPLTPDNWNALREARLDEQMENIRLTPVPMSTDDLMKLWTAFSGKYRPSVAYQAAVILLDITPAPRLAQPVRTRVIHTCFSPRPSITSVTPQIALAGDTMLINGTHLLGTNTRGEIDATSIDKISGTADELTLRLPDTLPIGIRTLKVAGEFTGTDQKTHRLVSNGVPFLLAPALDAAGYTIPHGSHLVLHVTPFPKVTQQIEVFIDGQAVTPSARAQDTDPISVPIPATATPGTFPLRVRVDGIDALVSGAASQRFVMPEVIIT